MCETKNVWCLHCHIFPSLLVVFLNAIGKHHLKKLVFVMTSYSHLTFMQSHMHFERVWVAKLYLLSLTYAYVQISLCGLWRRTLLDDIVTCRSGMHTCHNIFGCLCLVSFFLSYVLMVKLFLSFTIILV